MRQKESQATIASAIWKHLFVCCMFVRTRKQCKMKGTIVQEKSNVRRNRFDFCQEIKEVYYKNKTCRAKLPDTLQKPINNTKFFK